MRRYLIVTMPLVLLAACQKPASPQPGASTAAEPSSASAGPSAEPSASAIASLAADKAAITAQIDRVVASYRKDKPIDFTLSPAFERAWNRAVGKGGLDYDPICNCQDYDAAKFRHRMKSLEVTGDSAVVQLDIDAGFDDWSPLKLTFVREGGKWLLDDIGSKDQASLKRDMAKAEPGSFGIGE